VEKKKRKKKPDKQKTPTKPQNLLSTVFEFSTELQHWVVLECIWEEKKR